ncbi:uncharacterized protein LOC118743648 [Rhagoletis pomonella]|uniref:uncharacterized protein LOC118743648 n=1 Tax=Rhagoletis pomonella TaxID=28610 RepID=UPI00177D7B8A|nr:uncharacterized protein LOC118743648 [Rhagoletis pomonella]
MSSLYKHFKLIFIYFVAMQLKAVQNERFVKLIEITCENVNPSLLNVTFCKMEHVSRDVFEVTVEAALNLRPANNSSLYVAFVRRGREDRRPMLEYKIDCCAFFRNKRRNSLANFVYRTMGFENYSNMNHTCPYDHDFLLDHYPFNGQTIGKISPFGNGFFTFHTKWYLYDVLTTIANVSVHIFDR